MRKITFGLVAGFLFANLPFAAYAQDLQAVEAEIRAECVEESKNAENPEIYIEECVADKMQSIRDSQGSGDMPPGDRG